MSANTETKRITIELTLEESAAFEQFKQAEGRNSLANAVVAAARRGITDWAKNDPRVYQLPALTALTSHRAA